MKQVDVWRYYLSNYHENWDKLHWICKLGDEVGKCVGRYYPSNDKGGLRQIAMNRLVVGWSSYMCLKVLSQQWSGGIETNCTISVNCGMKQLHVSEGSKSATTRTDWDQLQWIKKLWDMAVMYVWRYHLSNNWEGLRQMAAQKPQ